MAGRVVRPMHAVSWMQAWLLQRIALAMHLRHELGRHTIGPIMAGQGQPKLLEFPNKRSGETGHLIGQWKRVKLNPTIPKIGTA
ncbi:unnamed protein product [Nezara viridula]|uniref:Neuropeptide n=1 Tax=Nezara viridula TaxID=85310 RepID=A0A9P0E8K0_NEZVI|nr:unnamed protein product [Nezara viridula]